MRPVSAILVFGLVSGVLAFAGGLALPAMAAVPDPTAVGTCMWGHVSDADKAEIAANYHEASADLVQRLPGFTGGMEPKKAMFLAAYAQCDATPNIPPNWIVILAAARSVRVGAAAELSASPHHVTQAQLDYAWENAPKPAVDCVMANAIATFGIPQSPALI